MAQYPPVFSTLPRQRGSHITIATLATVAHKERGKGNAALTLKLNYHLLLKHSLLFANCKGPYSKLVGCS